MMSALECIEKALHCEQMARDTVDRDNRRILREAAEMWRRLSTAPDPMTLSKVVRRMHERP